MAVELLKGVLGLFVLLGFWAAIQAYLRRRYARPHDFDVLHEMTHGCGACGGHGHGKCSGGGGGHCHD